jgi:hypothetical protein
MIVLLLFFLFVLFLALDRQGVVGNFEFDIAWIDARQFGGDFVFFLASSTMSITGIISQTGSGRRNGAVSPTTRPDGRFRPFLPGFRRYLYDRLVHRASPSDGHAQITRIRL